MWLFTIHGFFSATLSRTEPDKVQLRARSEKDLAALQKAFRLEDRKQIVTPNADYICRIILTRFEFVGLMMRLGEQVDYFNFKDRVHREPGQEDKSGPYMDVWSTMNRYQRSKRDGHSSGLGPLFNQSFAREIAHNPFGPFRDDEPEDDMTGLGLIDFEAGEEPMHYEPQMSDLPEMPPGVRRDWPTVEEERIMRDQIKEARRQEEEMSPTQRAILKLLRENHGEGGMTIVEIAEALHGKAGRFCGPVFRSLYTLKDLGKVQRNIATDRWGIDPAGHPTLSGKTPA